MTHPDQDRLTAWVHGLLDLDDAAAVDAHVSGCPGCREAADELQDEGRLLAAELGSSERLDALKARILASAGRRPNRGLFWQAPVAAAVLFGLVAVLLSPKAEHRLVEGRLALDDGRVLLAPTAIPSSNTLALRAVDRTQVRLTDRSTVDLTPGSKLVLSPKGPRGFTTGVLEGEATITVSSDPDRLRVIAPAGQVEAAEGRLTLKIVKDDKGGDSMNPLLAGAIVTVFAGSASLSTEHGRAEAQPGQSMVLIASEAPLFLAAPQEKQEDLLKRLEQLAARVAKLEDEVARLEEKNRKLKAQLTSNAVQGGAWQLNGSAGGLRVAGSSGEGAAFVIELTDEDAKKLELKKTDVLKIERKEK